MNQLLKTLHLENTQIELLEGDITQEAADAIVNAANSQLMHGGGVAAAIAAAGGEIVQRQSTEWVKKHGAVPHDRPAYTGAGNLPGKYVIHAVGPVWGDGNEDEKLASAIEGSLLLVEQLALSSIAFPSISTGIFGFPRRRAAGVFFNTLKQHFEKNPDSCLRKVKLVLFGQAAAKDFLEVFESRMAPSGQPSQ